MSANLLPRPLSLAATTALGLVLFAQPALAQPNPFEAHETKKQVEQDSAPAKTTQTNKAAAPATQEEAPPLEGTYQQQGRWLLGVNSSFSFTNANNELESGGERNNSTLFLRIAPALTVFAIDNLEVGASVGWIARRLDRGDSENNTERSWLIEAMAHYHVPFTPKLSLVPGLGLGFYFGSSERDITRTDPMTMMEQTIPEETDTLGFGAVGYLNFAYMLSSSIQMRAGLQGTFLIGREAVESTNSNLGVRTFYTGLNFGLHYYF